MSPHGSPGRTVRRQPSRRNAVPCPAPGLSLCSHGRTGHDGSRGVPCLHRFGASMPIEGRRGSHHDRLFPGTRRTIWFTTGPPGENRQKSSHFWWLGAEGVASCRCATRPQGDRATHVFPCFLENCQRRCGWHACPEAVQAWQTSTPLVCSTLTGADSIAGSECLRFHKGYFV
jgi:hypothetical protein